MKIVEKRGQYHSLIWLVAGVITFILFAPSDATIGEGLVDTCSIILPALLLTYPLFYFKDYLFAKKHYLSFAVVAVTWTIIIGCIAAIFSGYLYDNYEGIDVRQWIQNMSVVAFLVVTAQMAKRGIVSQLELQKVQLINTKMELHLLKAQLNPHFLFNTINNICGVNQVDPDKSTEMLINLADMLRYHLEFSKAQDICISKEIQLIEAFIELEKMRLRDNCIITFERPTENLMASIAPLILLPYIENAFKHGTHSTLPCFIKIKLAYTYSQLELKVENSIFNNKRVIKTNIGQENTAKRLQLIYPNKHQLHVDQNDEIYVVTLIVDL